MKYEKAKAEVVLYDNSDVITNSQCHVNPNGMICAFGIGFPECSAGVNSEKPVGCGIIGMNSVEDVNEHW